MTKAEWMSAPREFNKPARLMTLEEFRANNGYNNPVDDHGSFRMPHGISKAERRRMNKRFEERTASMVAGAAKYNELLVKNEIPMIVCTVDMRCDGLDLDSTLASARVHHRRSVMRAVHDKKPVPLEVLADYPEFLAP